MKITTNECRGCDLPCIGRACPDYAVTRYYCDECESETTLYEWGGRELCIDCIKEELEVVEGSDVYDY